MADGSFSSLDAACVRAANEPAPKAANIARRSISVFSRRGTDIPEPRPTFIAQAAMNPSKPASPQMTERQKSWIGRRKRICTSPKSPKSSQSKTPKGTILHAVPPAKIIEMSPLEEEMATSPNEEILSAISEHAPTLNALNGPNSLPISPIQQHDILRSKSTASLTQRSKSQKRKEANSRIGVWVDGVVRWDYSALDELVSQDAELLGGTGFTPVRPVTSGGEMGTGKPLLSVVIPRNEPRITDRTLSTIVHPQSKRPVISVAPASIVSKLQVSPPSIVLNEAEITPGHERTTTPERPRTAGHTDSHRSHASISSISSRVTTDADSVYSRRSSATSVSLSSTPEKQHRLSSGKFSLLSPTQAGVFDGPTKANLNKSLPPTPSPTPPVRAPARLSKTVRLALDPERLQPAHPLRQSRSMSQLDQCDEEFMRNYVARRHAGSPTLSQAEQDLRSQLSTMEEMQAKQETSGIPVSDQEEDNIKRRDSVRDVMQPPARAPTIPKRSRKRDWRKSKHPAMPEPQLSGLHALTRTKSEVHPKLAKQEPRKLPLRKAASVSCRSTGPVDFTFPQKPYKEQSENDKDQFAVPDAVADTTDVDSSAPSPVLEEDEAQSPSATVPAASAEEVLLKILSSLTSTDDLSNTAMINKGMYIVYKENEMQLVRLVSYNQSPPAWELREWSQPDRSLETASNASSKASSQMEHTPLTYLRCCRRDLGVIERLKRLILENCQTFIRRETAFALTTPSHPNAQRFNDAFWRIWCFCEIFGSRKGREDDFTGQLDWLKGGLLANNQGCVATVNTNLDFDMSSVLINAPDYFGKANGNGLSAAQLFDMTEIWTCLAVLLQGYSDRVNQAREYGIFDKCDVKDGDIEKEEQMLEEWISFLLTLGPSVVLDMALLASDETTAAFAYAKEQGWTNWTPPVYDGSRSNFLKEPVAKCYEDQVAVAKIRLQDPVEQEQKEMSRKRVASMAAEIRLRRQSSEYHRLPLIDMKNERAMSIMSRRNSVVSTFSSSSSSSKRSTYRRASASPATSASPTSLWKAPRSISPIIEDRVENFNRISLQNYAGGIAEDTSEIAVQRIVSMGFPVTRAREALRITDMGEGLRVDRAIEYLLRQQEIY